VLTNGSKSTAKNNLGLVLKTFLGGNFLDQRTIKIGKIPEKKKGKVMNANKEMEVPKIRH